jgi:hypothetical protein
MGEDGVNFDIQTLRQRLAENSEKDKRAGDSQNRSKKKRRD